MCEPRAADTSKTGAHAEVAEAGCQTSVVAVAYWAAWVVLGVWGFRFLHFSHRGRTCMLPDSRQLFEKDRRPAARSQRKPTFRKT